MMKKVLLLMAGCLLFFSAYAQTDSTSQQDNGAVTVSGFVDSYYNYSFNRPASRNIAPFLYSHHRHNEFAINNVLITARYNSNRLRATAAMHTGTYVRANYAAEPQLLQLIYEASAGVKLGKKTWIDAGVFPSHLGFESAISKDNWTLTRSIMADNSPYYESGIKLTYAPGSKWTLVGLLLNGWQNIAETNSNKAVGTQVQFRPKDNILLNYSTFIGNERPDTARQMRYFQDFYASFTFSRKLSMVAVFDIGLEEKTGRDGYNNWHTAALMFRYNPVNRFFMTLRGEYYYDPGGVIVNYTLPGYGFNTGAASLTLSFIPVERALFRIEGRAFGSSEEIFESKNQNSNHNVMIVSSLTIGF